PSRATQHQPLTTASTGPLPRAPDPRRSSSGSAAATVGEVSEGAPRPLRSGAGVGGSGDAPPDGKSVGLFTDAEPVLVPLGDVAERRGVAHPVQVHEAAQVAVRPLADADTESVGAAAPPLPGARVALRHDRPGARHNASTSGD